MTDTTTPAPEATAAPALLMDEATTPAPVEGQPVEETETPQVEETETETPQVEETEEPKTDEKVVPEEYAPFEFAEGTTVDDEAVAELQVVAKELNLSQDEAQKFAGLAEKMSQRWAEGLNNHILETRTGWRDAVKSDKEIGGDNLPVALGHAKAAIEAFGSPELKQLMDDTGFGDNPEFIRFAARVGKANSEHDFVKSGKPAAEISFYDHPSSKPKG